MGKLIEQPALSAGQMADDDVLYGGDMSATVGQRDATFPLGALREYLGAGITVGVQQAAHGLSVGDVVRFDGTDYVQATADTAANSEAVGVVTAAETDAFAYQTAGVASTLSGLTPGELYYLQDDGSLGTSAGTVEKPILIATSATSAVLILAISGEGGGGGDTSGLLPKLATVNSYAGNHSLDADDSGAYVRVTAAGTVTLPDGLDTGFQCVIVNATASDTVALSAATALTLPSGFDAEVQNRRAVTVIHVGAGVWEAHGALVEAP